MSFENRKSTAAGTWDVKWPASSVNNNIAVYDWTTWKIIKDGGNTIAQVLDRANHTGTQSADTITEGTTNAVVTVKERDALNLSSSNTRLTGWDVTATPWGTTFDYTGGTWYYIDVNTGARTEVSWVGATGVAITNIATTNVTAVWIDKDWNLVQDTTPLSPTKARNTIYLDFILHTWGTVDEVVEATIVGDFSVAAQISDLAEAIGSINLSGNVMSPNGVNMSIDLSPWKVFRHLANYKTDKKDPSTLTFPGQTALTFISTWRDWVGWYNVGWPSTTLLSGVYDDWTGGALQPNGTVANNSYMNYHVFLAINNLVFVQYWGVTYSSLADAQVWASTEAFSKNPELTGTLALGWISVKGNATDLSDAAQAAFTPAAGIASSSWAWAIFTRQAVYDVSVQPQTITSAALWADTWRGWTGNDTDKTMQWQNNAGVTTASIDGNWLILWSNLSWTNTGDQSWGDITGTLSDQTDLQTALNNKVNVFATPIDNRIIRANGTSWTDVQISQMEIQDNGTLNSTGGDMKITSTTWKANFFGAAPEFALNVAWTWLNARISLQGTPWDNPGIQLQNDWTWDRRVLFRLNEVGTTWTEMQVYTVADWWTTAALSTVFKDDWDLDLNGNDIQNVTNLWVWTPTPWYKAHIFDGASWATAIGWFAELVIEDNSDTWMSIISPNTSIGSIWFWDPENGAVGRIRYNHSADAMLFNTNWAERFRVDSVWNFWINLSVIDAKFHVNAWTSVGTHVVGIFWWGSSWWVADEAQIRLSTNPFNADLRGVWLSAVNESWATQWHWLAIYTNTNNTSPVERARFNKEWNLWLNTTNPIYKLDVSAWAWTPSSSNAWDWIRLLDSSISWAAPSISVIWKRSDANTNRVFSWQIAMAGQHTSWAVPSWKILGTLMFWGNHTDWTEANILYSSSIQAVAEWVFNSSTDMPSALTFNTGSVWRNISEISSLWVERARIDAEGNFWLWTASPNANFHISGGSFVTSTIESITADPVLQLTSDASINTNDWTMRMDVSSADDLSYRYDNTTRLTVTTAWDMTLSKNLDIWWESVVWDTVLQAADFAVLKWITNYFWSGVDVNAIRVLWDATYSPWLHFRNSASTKDWLIYSDSQDTDTLVFANEAVRYMSIKTSAWLVIERSLSVKRKASAVNTNTSQDTIIGVTDTSVARTVTLTDTNKVDGRVYIIKDESGWAWTNNITISPQSWTIDWAASVVISANYWVARVYSDGTNWFTY